MRNRGILVAGGVVVVAIIAFVVFRAVSPAAQQQSAAPNVATTAPAPPPPQDEEAAKRAVPRITPDELLPLYKSGAVAVVDVRDLDSFAAQHIPGALHLPLAQVDSMIALLPKNKPIVFYCT